MKYSAVILAIIITTAFSACKRTKTCPAYDGSGLHKWFPYEKGVTYKFTSSDGRQEMFTIEQENYSQAHKVDKSTWGKEYYCEINGERKTAIDSVMQEQIPLRLFHVVETDIHNIINYGIQLTFRSMNTPLRLSDGGDKLTLTDNRNGQYKLDNFDVWEVNGRNYRGIADITIQDEAAAKVGMDKIYIGLNAGIIGYRTYPGGREYWQQ